MCSGDPPTADLPTALAARGRRPVPARAPRSGADGGLLLLEVRAGVAYRLQLLAELLLLAAHAAVKEHEVAEVL